MKIQSFSKRFLSYKMKLFYIEVNDRLALEIATS